ncbi:NADH dehydrogenase FAD-containing subunit, partial [Enterococcus faecalis]
SVPLRVFYGMVWFVESMKKIVGNGDYLKPSTWFGDGSRFTDKVVFPFPWLQEQVTTGASKATETATTAASCAADAAG